MWIICVHSYDINVNWQSYCTGQCRVLCASISEPSWWGTLTPRMLPCMTLCFVLYQHGWKSAPPPIYPLNLQWKSVRLHMVPNYSVTRDWIRNVNFCWTCYSLLFSFLLFILPETVESRVNEFTIASITYVSLATFSSNNGKGSQSYLAFCLSKSRKSTQRKLFNRKVRLISVQQNFWLELSGLAQKSKQLVNSVSLVILFVSSVRLDWLCPHCFFTLTSNLQVWFVLLCEIVHAYTIYTYKMNAYVSNYYV